ncbi:MAG: PliI family lysozyme inhibitor of I-type lysozyme [Shewanella sp.]|nr:PliI family lysozyme inhibitor of I-type lysozyme [Shewanella sp.]MCF1431263.1 PliI family lysozyme inhibitor of I-type lysozyme [Shewanella sp.]MCF1437498.1 PliI family lysozyme inhibitor of I-type lysozyme [Shewanella sp.]MCF1459412.1 PliI family lysozyme inhibitor of I-type lysozyme [Shewanella sp.]
MSLLPLLFVSACSQTPVPCDVPTPNHSGYFNQALNLPQGGQVVVEEGALEPRSIGSITVLLYRDLEVGDFVSGLSFARDGFITSAELVSPQQLKITTTSAGSGSYQQDYWVCVGGGRLQLCKS